MNESEHSRNAFQSLSTILAALLPLVQILLSFIPQNSLSVVLFKDELLIVTIIAAIFAYMLIIAFKNTNYFEFTFNWRQHRRYKEFQYRTNQLIFTPQEIQQTLRTKWVARPHYVTPLNIYYSLLVVVVLLFLGFLALGLFAPASKNTLIIFGQATIYILLIALTSLTLGVFYINETNRDKRQQIEQQKWRRVLGLIFESRAVPELPSMEFVAHLPPNFTNLQTIIRIDGRKYYRITTDVDATQMQEISPYDPNANQTLQW